jgi:hypothetical protein
MDLTLLKEGEQWVVFRPIASATSQLVAILQEMPVMYEQPKSYRARRRVVACHVSSALADSIKLTTSASSTAAGVVMEPLDPALTLTMSSLSGDQPAAMTFNNRLPSQVDVWWKLKTLSGSMRIRRVLRQKPTSISLVALGCLFLTRLLRPSRTRATVSEAN